MSLVFLWVLAGSHTIWAQQEKARTLFARVGSSLVTVSTVKTSTDAPLRGSGIVIRPHQVITSCALVSEEGAIEIHVGSRSMAATLLLADQDRELCLLAVPGLNSRPAQRGASTSLVQQGSVWGVAGTGGANAVEPAIITQLRGTVGPLIETTLVATPSLLGRGVFDQQGHLVGITTVFKQGKRQLYFAAPVEWLSSLHAGRGKDGASRSLYWLKRAALAEKNADWAALRELSQSWSGELPENSTAWHSLGYACIQLEQPQEALQAFQETVRIDPSDIDGWSNIGFAQSDLMHFSEAAQAYEQVVSLRPGDVEGWLNLSLASAAAGEHARSLKALDALKQLDPVKAGELQSYYDQGGSLRIQESHTHRHE
ncbi:serine protease [Desulfobulbus rhabdoformis]|uniref:tetratricopeptide repeat-containing S1 family peptidase n=1 Tax=Desulfobulbus rhabdoformis TaxID=34032 RepID=UPI001964F5FA|nr:tetratricopeptide repeat-containing serine protease family protein [Desulfobulbus rhabdoformis]MBM9614815.1 serine protease [Desulfobulbus rhabdoformis]